MKHLFILILILNFPGVIHSQNYSTSRWKVTDITLKSNKISDDPLNVDAGAVFTHEDGSNMRVPAFYDGENVWQIRFSPPKNGKWKYVSYSSEPSLAGEKGSIEVRDNPDAHGPIQVDPNNPQKFTYTDGTPYNLMAYELDWLFALDAQNDNDIPRTRNIVKHLSNNGFNQVVMNVYAYDAGWGERDKIDPKYDFSRPEVFPFLGTNENPDFSGLNISFFRHLDRVIEHLNEQEIIAHLMIYVWNKKVNWPEPESAADDMYFDYVIKRYQAYPNLIWDISKEALAYGRDDMGYITRRIERLKKLDGHDRLVTVHDYNYCRAFPGKVDFISIQEWRPNLYNEHLEVRDRHPNKPVLNIEHGGYEKTMHSIFDGSYTDEVVCLDRNYQCLFAGAYSTYYWQNSAWYEVMFEPEKLKPEQKPNLEYFRHFSDFMDTFQFHKLSPTQYGFTPYCLTDNASMYIFYLPPGMIALNGGVPELKGKRIEIYWWDAFTGEIYPGGSRRFENDPWLGFRRHESITSPMTIAIFKIVE